MDGRTDLSVCTARLRQLYRDGSPTHTVSTAFFRAAQCFFGFPAGDQRTESITDSICMLVDKRTSGGDDPDDRS